MKVSADARKNFNEAWVSNKKTAFYMVDDEDILYIADFPVSSDWYEFDLQVYKLWGYTEIAAYNEFVEDIELYLPDVRAEKAE